MHFKRAEACQNLLIFNPECLGARTWFNLGDRYLWSCVQPVRRHHKTLHHTHAVLSFSYMSYLVAMRKTQESLRRLKKGKTSAFSLFGGGSPTANREQESKEEERVRVQMILDVAALGNDARSLHVDVDNHIAFRELEAMAAQGNGEGTSQLYRS